MASLEEEAKTILDEFAGNVCSSQNLGGYKRIVIWGGKRWQRERLCEAVIDALPPCKSVPYVDCGERENFSDTLYVDARRIYRRINMKS